MKITMNRYIVFSLIMLLAVGCNGKKGTENAIFRQLSPGQTGIDFNNAIVESDSFNMYTFMNLYTGGGVAIGDIDNDGLNDVFFSGNITSSKLYLNKGDLKFEDITEQAAITYSHRWCTGTAMVDINQDGFLDIYVTVSGIKNHENLLFINNGDRTFTEQAKAYGIADSRQMMHSSFFDYDKDGDLDLFLIVNPVDYVLSKVNRVVKRSLDGESNTTDVLYRNNGDGTFTDVSDEAGILTEGYGLGATTFDINNDGWIDIYVSNDFLTNDILYINNGDGSFRDRTWEYLNHSSFAGMGSDINDFNNDGLLDIMVADMLPEDNLRRMLIIPTSSYDKTQLSLRNGYLPQYTRNTLQLNNGDGTFSEIGQLANIDKTDWSWSTLFADFNNDGHRDLFITNGFGRDVGSLDYINYQKVNSSPFGKETEIRKRKIQEIQALPRAEVMDYVFENNGDLTFTKRSEDWGITKKSCSNGAAFGDLDNDGDLEMVVNVANDHAFIYENRSNEINTNGFVKVRLTGPEGNKQGLGTKVYLYQGAQMQFAENSLYRGYQSSVDPTLHFGVGQATSIDSLKIIWPDGKTQVMQNLAPNSLINATYTEASNRQIIKTKQATPLFQEVSSALDINYIHEEKEYIDFNSQPLLPHKHSENGPSIAVGDINGDLLDDFYIGGSADYPGRFFTQQIAGTFKQEALLPDSLYEDMGSLLFDADGDGDQDLYVVSGGSSFEAQSNKYQDRFYANDGKGNFTLSPEALPTIISSGSSVVASDYDSDGDLDLFIGGRVVPGEYPKPAKSYLLRNDSQGSSVKFTDITEAVIPDAANIGLVTSALWTDYDNDNAIDLLITGEWMPLSFFKYNGTTFELQDIKGLENTNGWWNSLVSGDFDGDGDTDYVAGNLGLNSRRKASVDEPVCIYAKDFDANGSIDPVMCQYIDGKNYIVHPRDLLINQLVGMRSRFKTYKEFGSVTFEKSFLPVELRDAYIVKSETFETSYFENKGNNEFERKALPMLAQIAPMFGMKTGDFNQDGNLDLLMVGNSFSTEVSIGRYDASKGLYLEGDGKGNFTRVSNGKKGFFVDADCKSLSSVLMGNNNVAHLVGRNADSLKVFTSTQPSDTKKIKVLADDRYALVHYPNGKIVKEEFYYGSTYLSQSSRILEIPKKADKILIFNTKGEQRTVNIDYQLTPTLTKK